MFPKNRTEAAESVIFIFKVSMGQLEDVITEDTIISDAFPDMDHLDRIDIIMDIEARFEVIIKDEDIVYPQEDNYTFDFKLKTIKEFVDLVIEKVNAKKGTLNLSIDNE